MVWWQAKTVTAARATTAFVCAGTGARATVLHGRMPGAGGAGGGWWRSYRVRALDRRETQAGRWACAPAPSGDPAHGQCCCACPGGSATCGTGAEGRRRKPAGQPLHQATARRSPLRLRCAGRWNRRTPCRLSRPCPGPRRPAAECRAPRELSRHAAACGCAADWPMISLSELRLESLLAPGASGGCSLPEHPAGHPHGPLLQRCPRSASPRVASAARPSLAWHTVQAAATFISISDGFGSH